MTGIESIFCFPSLSAKYSLNFLFTTRFTEWRSGPDKQWHVHTDILYILYFLLLNSKFPAGCSCLTNTLCLVSCFARFLSDKISQNRIVAGGLYTVHLHWGYWLLTSEATFWKWAESQMYLLSPPWWPRVQWGLCCRVRGGSGALRHVHHHRLPSPHCRVSPPLSLLCGQGGPGQSNFTSLKVQFYFKSLTLKWKFLEILTDKYPLLSLAWQSNILPEMC